MARPPRRPVNVPLLSASIAGGLLVVALVVGWSPQPPTASGPTVTPLPVPVGPAPEPPKAMANLTIVPAGTSYLVAAGTFVDVLFQLTMPAELSGEFEATANVTATVLTATAFQAFEASGGLADPAWSTGATASGTVTTALAAGTYYLVFSDAGASAPWTVASPSGILADFPLPA